MTEHIALLPALLSLGYVPSFAKAEGVLAVVSLTRLREAEEEVSQDGNKQRDADEERAPQLVERAGVPRGDHREAFLEERVAVDEGGRGTASQSDR